MQAVGIFRKIIHIDMDAFYAAVEQRDDPGLRGKPVAVGGGGRRGVVMTASYEARPFGVHSAQASTKARRLCPELIFVPPRFAAYKEASEMIRSVFREYSDVVEPLSLDEAFLDVTCPLQGPPSGAMIALEIKREILKRTALTSTAGVSYNKFLAKVASGMNKPDGLTVIRPGEAEEFIAQLPIETFFGVGPATARRFKSRGIHTGEDLRERSLETLVRLFGKAGHWYYGIARGVDSRPVSAKPGRKSISAERTFIDDIAAAPEMQERVSEIASDVSRRMEKAQLKGRTVTVKIKFHDFSVITRSRTMQNEVSSAAELCAIARDLLSEACPGRPIRLLGVGVAKLRKEASSGSQLDLGLRRPDSPE